MTDTPELKPCPFCGGEADFERPYGTQWAVKCNSQGICSGNMTRIATCRKEVATRLWNTRLPHPTDDEVDRVAIAIYETVIGPGAWRVAGNTRRLLAKRKARAAISAMSPREGEDGLLATFGEHEDWELSHTYADHEEMLPARWIVHKHGGSINDQTWTEIGTGETPEAAIRAAISSTAMKGKDDE